MDGVVPLRGSAEQSEAPRGGPDSTLEARPRCSGLEVKTGQIHVALTARFVLLTLIRGREYHSYMTGSTDSEFSEWKTMRAQKGLLYPSTTC